jgi:hypothetical protein
MAQLPSIKRHFFEIAIDTVQKVFDSLFLGVIDI